MFCNRKMCRPSFLGLRIRVEAQAALSKLEDFENPLAAWEL